MANFGALSSLGIGSGVLTYDVIDKLRKADEETIVKPLDNRIETLHKQQEALNTIVTKTAALKSSVLDLSDSVFLAKRTVDVAGSGIEVEVSDGVAVQELDIAVNRLAKAGIDQSKGFESRNSSVTDTDTTMTLEIDGQSYTLEIEAGTTLEDLAQMITDKTDGKAIGTIIDTGGANPYSLVVKSSATGADQAISYSYGDEDFLSMSNVQAAQDAEFVYNGVTILRPSNTVDDLIYGMTLTLKKADPASENHVSIKQDNEAIVESVQTFVDAYNDLMEELTTDTRYDIDTKQAGLFQGEGILNALKIGIQNTVLGMTAEGGLPDLGITVDRSGIMSLDTGKLTEALQNDPDKVSGIFAGDTESPGVFARLNDFLRDQTLGTDSTLTRFDGLLKDRLENLEETRERKLRFLDTKYEIMARRFSAYDKMIQQMNASFVSLQNMIDAMNNASKK